MAKQRVPEYPDDIFAPTRMSFGEHIEELRQRMFKALKWLFFFLVIGFVLDSIGTAMDNPNIGVGRPMLKIITEPVEQQVRDFYYRRNQEQTQKKLAEDPGTPQDEIDVILQKLKDNGYNLSELTEDERTKLRFTYEEMPIILDAGALANALGIPAAQVKQKEVLLSAKVMPTKVNYVSQKGEAYLGNKQHIAAMSVQEGFVVYFKVSILCSIVLASPFILYQFWAFVGAGLYPHEKRYVYMMFGPSLFLFIGGILLCQFLVIPGAIKALLAFNEWLGFDPDIRLREWLSLAIILPLVFGVSFQTPLVMVFFNRIGLFTAADYLSKWRVAVMVIAVFAALITPTPDIVTMLYLFVPMFGLYMLGVVICHYFPGVIEENAETEAAEEVAV